MTSDQWSKIKATFNQAVELQTAERENLLAVAEEDVRFQVEKMLAADSLDLLEQSPLSQFLGETNFYQTPKKIGRYKIIREIGRGGMGTVYEAVRDDGEFTQKVALKIIKRGMDSEDVLRRFRNERQILAGLRHPNIAFITDGGISENNSPFFAMEYVEGVPVDVFCTEKNLSINERLELFRKVCQAVSYAHNNLIVHRDLKPSNILVTADGEPKLLDFGIAKVLDTDSANAPGTATHLGMMTPAYASPEQLRGAKISTATDIYSLGVILYELLAGERPFKIEGKGFGEILEIVSSTVPPRPSNLSLPHKKNQPDLKSRFKNFNLLKNDIDVIVLKAMRKNASRRYNSVEQFSEDIRRHLNKLPITARPDTFFYRFSKFIKRNKIAVASAAGVFLSLCVGITVAVWQAHEAQIERARAEKRFDEVRQLANKVVFKYHDAIADIQGTTAVRAMLIKDALQYLDSLSIETEMNTDLQKEVARAYLKLGDVQGKMYDANLGDTEGAITSYQKAVALLEKVVQEKNDDIGAKESLIKSYNNLAFLELRSGSSLENQELVEKSFAQFEELKKLDPATDRRLELIEIYVRLGDVATDDKNRTDFDKRLTNHLQALKILEENFQINSADYENAKAAARVYQRLGSDYIWLGERAEKNNSSEEAKNLYANSLANNQKCFSAVSRMTELQPESATTKRYQSAVYNNLAESLAHNHKFDEALQSAQKTFDLATQNFRTDSGNKETKFGLSTCYELYAKIYLLQKNYKKYFEFSDKMLALDKEILRDDPKNSEVSARIQSKTLEIANIYEQTGNHQKAGIYREIAAK